MASPQSTRAYREEALAIQARTDLRPCDRQRLLAMLRIECHLVRRANKGEQFPDEPGKVALRPPSPRYLERRALADGNSRPDVLAKRAEGGRIAYPKMQAALRKRRERIERSRLRQLHREIERQIAELL